MSGFAVAWAAGWIAACSCSCSCSARPRGHDGPQVASTREPDAHVAPRDAASTGLQRTDSGADSAREDVPSGPAPIGSITDAAAAPSIEYTVRLSLADFIPADAIARPGRASPERPRIAIPRMGEAARGALAYSFGYNTLLYGPRARRRTGTIATRVIDALWVLRDGDVIAAVFDGTDYSLIRAAPSGTERWRRPARFALPGIDAGAHQRPSTLYEDPARGEIWTADLEIRYVARLDASSGRVHAPLDLGPRPRYANRTLAFHDGRALVLQTRTERGHNVHDLLVDAGTPRARTVTLRATPRVIASTRLREDPTHRTVSLHGVTPDGTLILSESRSLLFATLDGTVFGRLDLDGGVVHLGRDLFRLEHAYPGPTLERWRDGAVVAISRIGAVHRDAQLVGAGGDELSIFVPGDCGPRSRGIPSRVRYYTLEGGATRRSSVACGDDDAIRERGARPHSMVVTRRGEALIPVVEPTGLAVVRVTFARGGR